MGKVGGRYVVWDFNGTILDDVQTGINSINVLLSRRGLPTLDGVEDYHAHFGFPIIEYYRGLGFDFEKEPFSQIAPEWVEQYDKFVVDAPLCDDVTETVERFRAAGWRQVILSATKQEMLERQLDELGIRALFDEALGMDTIEAHTKLPAGRAWIKRARPEYAVMIGDTIHDAQVAKEIGVDCVLVARGHQSRSTLEAAGAPVFDTLPDAATFILNK